MMASDIGPSAGAATQPFCQVSSATPLYVGNASLTSVPLETDVSDLWGFHSTSVNTDRITVPAGLGGIYIIRGQVDFAANATGERMLALQVDDTTWVSILSGPALPTIGASLIVVSGPTPLTAGQFLKMKAYQTSGGGALNVNTANFGLWRIA